MALLNYSSKEINSKIVYYGPGLSGKTTNIQVIYRKLRQDQRGQLVSLATQTDRTIFFDFLPIDLGEVKGFKTRFHLYTVPGQVFYNATRKVVLKGADGVVFVADSQRDMMEANIESLKNLEENLRDYGRELEHMPHVIQFNKRDLPNIASPEEMYKKLNKFNAPFFEASAAKGNGILDTFSAISKMVLRNLREKTDEIPAGSITRPEEIEAAKEAGYEMEVQPIQIMEDEGAELKVGNIRRVTESNYLIPLSYRSHGIEKGFSLTVSVIPDKSDQSRTKLSVVNIGEEGFKKEVVKKVEVKAVQPPDNEDDAEKMVEKWLMG